MTCVESYDLDDLIALMVSRKGDEAYIITVIPQLGLFGNVKNTVTLTHIHSTPVEIGIVKANSDKADGDNANDDEYPTVEILKVATTPLLAAHVFKASQNGILFTLGVVGAGSGSVLAYDFVLTAFPHVVVIEQPLRNKVLHIPLDW